MGIQQQHKGQRVGVFVDVQNLYYSAKHLYHAKVNFKAILDEAVKDRTLIRAITYVIKADLPDEQPFFDTLKSFGFEVKSKDLQVFYGGAKKGDWDIGIAMDMIETAPRLDAVVLISGDGDFVPLVQHLRRAMGCRAEVMAFGRSAAGRLKEEADQFTDLDVNAKQFLRGNGFEERTREPVPHTPGTSAPQHAPARTPIKAASRPAASSPPRPLQRRPTTRPVRREARPVPTRRPHPEGHEHAGPHTEPQYTTLEDY